MVTKLFSVSACAFLFLVANSTCFGQFIWAVDFEKPNGDLVHKNSSVSCFGWVSRAGDIDEGEPPIIPHPEGFLPVEAGFLIELTGARAGRFRRLLCMAKRT